MLIHYDLRLNLLVQTPGLEEALSSITLKRGGQEPFQVQFGRSPVSTTSQSAISEPTWTAEQLPGTAEIWLGIKAAGDFEGTALALEKTAVWDATNSWYDLELNLNTTALNSALYHDSTTGNDVAMLDDAMFEVKYRDSSGDPWRASRLQVTCVIHHNVLDGSEGTPAEAADPTDYILASGATQGTGIQEFLGVNLTDATELTIATGAITVTQGFHSVDTEADAASDDLDTITPAKGHGDELTLFPANDARDIVIKHGTGNITTFDGTDLTLNTAAHCIKLIYNGTNWLVVANSAAGAGSGDMLAATYDPTTVSGDAFDMDNMVEGTSLILTAAERSAITANTAKVSNANHTGNVTGSTVLTIAAGAVDIAMLSATGTPTSSTVLHGDNTWAAVTSTAEDAVIERHTVTAHGLSVNDVVYHVGLANWAVASATTNKTQLAGVVSNVVDSNTIDITFKGQVGGFTGLTVNQHYYTATSGAVSTTVSSRYVGMAVSTTVIFVDMGVSHFVDGDTVQRKIVPYDPSAAQTLTTTHADVAGSDYAFTPVFSDSTIAYKYVFHASADTTADGFMIHAKLLVDGVLETESEASWRFGGYTTEVGNGGMIIYEHSFDSWGTSAKTMKMQAREFNASFDGKLHETLYWDGIVSSKLKRATLTIEEIR